MEIINAGGYDCLVDDEDYEGLSQYNWYITKNPLWAIHYAVRQPETGSKKRILMHRQIMRAEKGQFVGHKDGNELNNQKSNLRFETVAQSQQKRRIGRNNTSGYKGVYLIKSRGTWQAQIYKAGKRYGLGSHDNIEDASRAYNEAALELFGEFARLNKI